MQFLLFDVGATLIFLFGYLTVVTLQRRRALLVVAASRPPRATRQDPAAERQPHREWPRLSYPR